MLYLFTAYQLLNGVHLYFIAHCGTLKVSENIIWKKEQESVPDITQVDLSRYRFRKADELPVSARRDAALQKQ